MKQTLSLYYSPCPNDTFIFAGLALGHVRIPGIEFDIHLHDIEELNQLAIQGKADVIKLSYHAYLSIVNDYIILDKGSALGDGVGPLLVATDLFTLEETKKKSIAIPGEHTTANLLLKLALGNDLNTEVVLFSEIEDAVLRGDFDAGVIIHENRFTYQSRGLKKIADLGDLWQSEHQLPIPLGGIAARRSLGEDLNAKLDQAISNSIDWAIANPKLSMPYIRAHAQAMEDEVMDNHIQLYVNDYTRGLGEKGRKSIIHLFDEAKKKGLIPENRQKPFMD